MTEPGKHAPGLKGFPTPNEAAGIPAYLLFFLDDPEWSQYILGAVKALEVGYNWYKSGELDTDAAAEVFRLINQEAPYNKLPTRLPSGGKVIRLSPSGRTEQADGDEWIPPDGEYTIPPTPPREEPTEDERRCLAAANAAHALEILYETLSDAWSDGLSTAEAVAAFIAAVVGVIGAVFGLITTSLIAILTLVFSVVYETLEFVGADVWDTGFTDKLRCILYQCASSPSDVVTFDFNCVIEKLANSVNIFDVTFQQIRLFGQLYYILQMLGADALDTAGSGTAVSSADCTECEAPPCFTPTVETVAQAMCTSDFNHLFFDPTGAYTDLNAPNSQGAFVSLASLRPTGVGRGWKVSFAWSGGSPTVYQAAGDMGAGGGDCVVAPIVDLSMTSGLLQDISADTPFVWIGWLGDGGAFHITEICVYHAG